MATTLKKRGRPKSAKKSIDPDYMSVTETAVFLKISVSHLYTLTSSRKIPHIKVLGKKLLFDKDKINEWLRSKEVRVKR